MDLSKIDLEAAASSGATLTLHHPVTDEELPVKIHVMGSDSKRFRQAIDRVHRARGKRRNKEQTLAGAEREAAELLAAVTTGWDGVEWEGKELPFNTENAVMLYMARPWIREQVDLFVGDAGNFFTKQKSS